MISRRAYLIITRVAKWRVVKQEGTSRDATESPLEYTMKVRLRDLYLSFSPRKRKRERGRERRIAAGSIVINYGGCLRELSGKVGVCQERNK